MFDMSMNPGFKLREVLTRRYPNTIQKRHSSYLANIDNALGADGAFLALSYNSTINYILRRLISGAAFVKNACTRDGLPEEEYNRRLRIFLRDELSVNQGDLERMHILAKECVRLRDVEPSDSIKRLIRRAAERTGGPQCYICGRAVTFSTQATDDSGEIEHVWPKDMGGLSEPPNLQVACFRCNKAKKSRVDSSEFHFEAICVVSDDADAHFLNEFNYEQRTAIRIHQQCRCAVCGKAARDSSLQKFRRISESDSWHFLNIAAICGAHGDEYGGH